jgi:hypothetical protein
MGTYIYIYIYAYRTTRYLQSTKKCLLDLDWIINRFRRVRKIARTDSKLHLSSFGPSVRMGQLCSHWKDFHEI